MSGDEPYVGHNPVVVLLLSLVGLIATPWLTGRGCIQLFEACVTRAVSVWKATATLASAAAVGVYSWGVWHLIFLDDARRSEACDVAVGERRLTGYAPSFIPLRFACRTSDGGTVDTYIPGYINPTVAVFMVCAIACTVVVRTRNHAVFSEEENR